VKSPEELEPGESAILTLSADEAVVLLDLLSRWSENRESAPAPSCFESSAECAVLHGICCDLEAQLVAPFRHDYHRLVAEARKRLEPLWADTRFSVHES